MSEVAEKAGEIAAEVVEESVDGVVEVMEVVRNNPVTLAVVGSLALAVGAAGGYFFAVRKLGKEFDARLAAEIEETKEFYAGVYKTDNDGVVLTPQEVLASRHGQAAVEALRTYQGRVDGPFETEEELDEQDEELLAKTETKLVETRTVSAGHIPEDRVVVEERTETRNVFVDPNYDYEEERKHRKITAPYIITHDEYFASDLDYEQVSLTYYEVDDTLANEKDEPIREVDQMVGDDCLARFGHGSKDKNIVYIRNDRLETDFEVIKSTGSYLEEVLGMPDEPDSLRHSDQRDRRRAFRHGDG